MPTSSVHVAPSTKDHSQSHIKHKKHHHGAVQGYPVGSDEADSHHTMDSASEPEQNRGLIEERKRARRPGGRLRGKRGVPFHD